MVQVLAAIGEIHHDPDSDEYDRMPLFSPPPPSPLPHSPITLFLSLLPHPLLVQATFYSSLSSPSSIAFLLLHLICVTMV